MKEPAPPPNLADFVEAIGVEDTLKLVETFGGLRVWIPTGLQGSHAALRKKFEDQFGAKTTKALIARFGGGVVFVPLCEQWRTDLYTARGLTNREIARRLHCNESTVWHRQKRQWHSDLFQPRIPGVD